MGEKLNVSIVEHYDVFVRNKIRDEKSTLFDDLYNEFLKLKLIIFYIAKSKILYYNKEFLKGEFLNLIKAVMTRKHKN